MNAVDKELVAHLRGEAFLNSLLKENQRQDLVIQALRAGIRAVRDLIGNSEGVAGLHMNGDVAPWSELQRGGAFEAWLSDFNAAEEV